jgi:hypothetical protein
VAGIDIKASEGDVPVAAADADRLAVLQGYGVLDTPPDADFDDIAQVASALCGAPVALVSLVDRDRQWFKAHVGVELAETPIEQSICVHGLGSDELLIIPDLTQDPRTRKNSLVTPEDGIRFYAGAPLIDPDGANLGMLCVIDLASRPAGLTPAQADGLRALARQTMRLLHAGRVAYRQSLELEEHKRLRLDDAQLHDALEVSGRLAQDNAARYRAAQQAAGIGTFEIDLATNVMSVSEEFCRLFGVPTTPSVDATEFLRNILDEDRPAASTVDSRRSGEVGRDAQYRIRRHDDGRIRWIGRRGAFVHDADGKRVKMFGVVQDITDDRLGRDRIAALLALGDRLRGAANETQVIDTALDILIETLGVVRVGYARIDRGADRLAVERDRTGEHTRSMVGVAALSRFSATLERLAHGDPVAADDLYANPDFAADWPIFEAMSVRAVVQAPLFEAGELVGVVFVHEAAPRAWSAEEIGFVESVTDRMEAAMAKTRAEAAQDVLNLELSHRLKNSFAMVQALAMQTLKSVADRAPINVFESRLHALSAAHDLLLQRSWSATELVDVIGSVAESLGVRGRFDLEGSKVMLGSKATLATSLLIHELATNAVKYGALSTEAGRVAVIWRVEDSKADPILTVTWREHGGPTVAEPVSRGFGSRLISNGLVGRGGAQVDYRPEGLTAIFTSPMVQIAANV